MTKRHEAWVFLADEICGRLLHCGVAPLGRCHVEEVEWFKSVWPGHEHGRPSPLSAKSGHSHASTGHEVDEELGRSARYMAAWLESQVHDRHIEHVVMFAPPRFLGAFRKIRPAGLANCVEERRGDLVGLDAGKLSDHPSIRGLVGLSTKTVTKHGAAAR